MQSIYRTCVSGGAPATLVPLGSSEELPKMITYQGMSSSHSEFSDGQLNEHGQRGELNLILGIVPGAHHRSLIQILRLEFQNDKRQTGA
jgi:hypothetical protein